MRKILLLVVVAGAVASAPLSLDARPNRYGHSDREECHMLPFVSSGPVDAIWTRVERSQWRSDAERDAFRASVDKARAFYQGLLRAGG